MNEYVKISVDSRIDFFNKYYSVPESAKNSVENFIKEITVLGESCSDSTEFESKFISSGLSEQFNNLLNCCTPKAYKMTDEEKQYSKSIAKDVVFEGGKKEIAKDIAKDVVDTIAVEAKEEAHAIKRKVMMEAGVYDEYTRVSNAIDDAGRVGKFIGGLFKKKK